MLVGVERLEVADGYDHRLAAARFDQEGQLSDEVLHGDDYPYVHFVTDAVGGANADVFAFVTLAEGGVDVLRLAPGAAPESIWSSPEAARSGALASDPAGYLVVVGDDDDQTWATRLAVTPGL